MHLIQCGKLCTEEGSHEEVARLFSQEFEHAACQ